MKRVHHLKIMAWFLCAVFCAKTLLAPTVAQAESPAGVVQTYSDDENLTLFVRGIPDDVTEVSLQIGSKGTMTLNVTPAMNKDVPMKTLILIDNSISIPESSRARIAELVNGLISDRADRELIELATYGESIEPLTEFTSDYATLKAALDGVQYVDRDTYLTDVLYDLLSELKDNDEPTLYRFIVISDGVDNKSIGITKEELKESIGKNSHLIYSIGSKTGKNDEALENMFAISRETGAKTFILEEQDDLLNVINELKEDRAIKVCENTFSGIDLDGSEQNCVLSFETAGGPVSVETSIKLPFDSVEEKEEAVEEEEEEDEYYEESIVDLLVEYWMYLAIALGVIVVLVVLLVVLIKKKKKDDAVEFSYRVDAAIQTPTPAAAPVVSPVALDTGKTEILSDAKEGETVMLMDVGNPPSGLRVRLTDISNRNKVFETSIESKVSIGRTAGAGGIAIDYDKSISGKHCELINQGGACYLKDLNSTNGTFVNGERIVGRTVELVSGVTLKLGRVEFLVEIL